MATFMAPKKTKTETSPFRRVFVYIPSFEMREDWKRRAEDYKSMSQFVIEHVQNSLALQDEDLQIQPRSEIITENQQLKENIQKLKKQNELLTSYAENLEKENKRYRAEKLTGSFELDINEYDINLINLLRSRGKVSEDDLYKELKLDPNDQKMISAVQKQLEFLEQTKAVLYEKGYWVWNL